LPKRFFQFVIQDLGPRLQKQVRPAERPMHLLPFDEAAAHNLVDRRLNERR
jgi:hypothetical protein